MRFVLAFGLCGMALGTLAVQLARPDAGMWWVLAAVEVYFSVCLLSLAAAYGLREAGMDVEGFMLRPRWSPMIRVILLPYLAVGGFTLYLYRWFDREGLLNPVTPGLYIGRLPFPSERPGLRAAGIQAVVNLCWEFPRLSGTGGEPAIETSHVPILDGCPPSDRQFEEAIRWITRWRAEGRSVLVHCAQGHGRSATIVAATLLRIGLAMDVKQALSMVNAARPLAKPSRKQWAALNRYTTGPGTRLVQSTTAGDLTAEGRRR